jgi:hypothetical protein
MIKRNTLNQLNRLYNDIENNASALGSLNNLYLLINRNRKVESVPLNTVRQYLHEQPVYTKHRPAVKNAVRRNRMIARGIGTDWQADLADMQHLAKHNNGTRYILCVIDIFTKMAHCRPLKRKNSAEVMKAFESIRKKVPIFRNCRLATDAGKEFLNSIVQQWFKKHKIKHYTLQGDHKAAIVERFQRTLKERLFRLMTFRKSYKYVHLLQNEINKYNRSAHRTLRGIAPINVNQKNEATIFNRQFEINEKRDVTRGQRNDISVGDVVKISVGKEHFQKGYTGYWQDELFTVAQVKQGVPNKIYTLKDKKGEILQGGFYREQILPIQLHNAEI